MMNNDEVIVEDANSTSHGNGPENNQGALNLEVLKGIQDTQKVLVTALENLTNAVLAVIPTRPAPTLPQLNQALAQNGEINPPAQNLNPPVQNLRSLKRFLGKVSYLRRFIPALAEITTPFSDLLKGKAAFAWKDEHQRAFERVKAALTSPLTMVAPQLGKPKKDKAIDFRV
ncbi:hypothetical protein Vadar_003497 [Vaccinium darrowii]|uniref:Uncharacterized protein n=1 Tax=Vaccinium darrowii TaxID=229202 RepID=A0ACB7ZGW1_9ERIC|nr:hypothetical protein Vadar_003497 [Vaccinium darrowii]